MRAVGLILAALFLGLARPSPATAQHSTAQPMISYFEIPVTDMDRAMAFYGKVLGFRFDRQTIDGYDMAVIVSDGPVFGALARGDVYVPGKAGPVLYFAVTDIRATLARAVAAGGSVLYPVKDIGENGWVAEFADSEGNRIALSQPRQP